MSAEVDWDSFRAKLPLASTPEDKARRKKMFNDFDPNGNGVLSLAETEKGVRDVMQLDDVFDMKPAIMRAFQAAKASKKSSREVGDDYIELVEFRYFLSSLRQYVELWVAFSRVDTSADRKISLTEFTQAASMIEEWVGQIEPEAEFKAIDTNGGGAILFDEFCEWGLAKQLDLPDDDD